MKRLLLTAAVALLGPGAVAHTWTADNAHSRLGFKITHMMVSEVDGSFRDFTAIIESSRPDFSDAVFELHVATSSINTGNRKRDAHLRTADYFDALKYPAISFKTTSFRKGSGESFALNGNLTMHGVTKAVTMKAVLVGQGIHPYSKKKVVGFKVTGRIRRLDFGVGAETGKAALGDDVDIVATGEFIQN